MSPSSSELETFWGRRAGFGAAQSRAVLLWPLQASGLFLMETSPKLASLGAVSLAIASTRAELRLKKGRQQTPSLIFGLAKPSRPGTWSCVRAPQGSASPASSSWPCVEQAPGSPRPLLCPGSCVRTPGWGGSSLCVSAATAQRGWAGLEVLIRQLGGLIHPQTRLFVPYNRALLEAGCDAQI